MNEDNEERFEVLALQIKSMGIGNVERDYFSEITEGDIDAILKDSSWFAPSTIVLIDFEEERIQTLFGDWAPMLDICLTNRGIDHYKREKIVS